MQMKSGHFLIRHTRNYKIPQQSLFNVHTNEYRTAEDIMKIMNFIFLSSLLGIAKTKGDGGRNTRHSQQDRKKYLDGWTDKKID